MKYVDRKVEELKIAYIGGGSRGWAWGLMSDLASADDISGEVALYDIDFEAAKASYETYAASVAEKASKPKAERKSKADPEKHAASIARAEAALAWLIENPGQHAAMEIKTALPEVYEEQTIMQVGTDLRALYKEKSDCGLVLESKGGKNYWSFNA